MQEYRMELCGVQRTLPFIKIKEDLAFASFVILGDTELVAACAGPLAEKIGPVDAVVTAEAKGIALAYAVSRALGLKEFIVARKSVKSYMRDVVSEEVHSITTQGACWTDSDLREWASTRGCTSWLTAARWWGWPNI